MPGHRRVSVGSHDPVGEPTSHNLSSQERGKQVRLLCSVAWACTFQVHGPMPTPSHIRESSPFAGVAAGVGGGPRGGPNLRVPHGQGLFRIGTQLLRPSGPGCLPAGGRSPLVAKLRLPQDLLGSGGHRSDPAIGKHWTGGTVLCRGTSFRRAAPLRAYPRRCRGGGSEIRTPNTVVAATSGHTLLSDSFE